MSLPTHGDSLDLVRPHLGTHGPLDSPHTVLPALEIAECYVVEATGQALMVYRTPEMAPGDWVQIDELEFSVDEWLSSDEVAQCIYTICGGDLDFADTVGETASYFVHYSAELRGQLGLVAKLNAVEQQV